MIIQDCGSNMISQIILYKVVEKKNKKHMIHSDIPMKYMTSYQSSYYVFSQIEKIPADQEMSRPPPSSQEGKSPRCQVHRRPEKLWRNLAEKIS